MAKTYEKKQVFEILKAGSKSSKLRFIEPDTGLVRAYNIFVVTDRVIKEKGREYVGRKKVISVLVGASLSCCGYGHVSMDPGSVGVLRLDSFIPELEDTNIKTSNLDWTLIKDIVLNHNKPPSSEDCPAVKIVKEAVITTAETGSDIILEDVEKLLGL